MDDLTEGRMVHYVAYNGRHLAAIVTGIVGVPGTWIVDLAVFTSMENVNGEKTGGLQFHFRVHYSSTVEPGTWHTLDQHGEGGA